MIRLSAETINSTSAYRVRTVSNDTIEFETDYGVEYHVNFMEDFSIWEKDAYQLVIINKNMKSSPNDEKLKTTLISIVENFFEENKNILLYICETGDGRQCVRSRLFLRWFREYEKSQDYFMQDVEIHGEGVRNFAALIVRHDNPYIDTIIDDFNKTTDLLKEKP